MGALDVINNQLHTQTEIDTNTNPTQLGGVAAANYARKDTAAGLQTFAVPVRVTGTESRGGQTVGITTSSNIGAFVS